MSGQPTSLLGDDHVARHAAGGDRRAFEEIFRRYHQPLYRFCLAMVGDASDAQDALQNTMVKLLRALPGEDRRIVLKPWLYRIARNEAVETLRRRPDQVEPEQEQVASPVEIAENAADRERLRRLLADIRELPERQRAALVMRELSGLGFDEIARALQTSPSTARQTLYEARLGLRQMEAGREMRCEAVTKLLSDGDGRAASRRDLRAHLRDCTICRAFREGIEGRQGQLAAIAPLPLAASTYLLHSVLGGTASGAAGASAGAGGAWGAIGSGAGQVLGSSAIVKSVAVIAAAVAIGTAADRGGLVDLPLPADGRRAANPDRQGDAEGESRSGGTAPAHAAAKARPTRQSGRRAAVDRSAGSGGSRAAAAGPGTAAGERQGEAGRIGSSAADKPAAGQSEGAASQGSPKSNSVGAAGSRGGGHGGSAPGQHEGSAPGQKGPPEELTEAASHGQQTAATHKPPQANGSPGPGSAGKGPPPSAPPGGGSPATPSPPSAPAEPPGQGVGGGASPGPPSGPPSDDPTAGPPPGKGGGPP